MRCFTIVYPATNIKCTLPTYLPATINGHPLPRPPSVKYRLLRFLLCSEHCSTRTLSLCVPLDRERGDSPVSSPSPSIPIAIRTLGRVVLSLPSPSGANWCIEWEHGQTHKPESTQLWGRGWMGRLTDIWKNALPWQRRNLVLAGICMVWGVGLVVSGLLVSVGGWAWTGAARNSVRNALALLAPMACRKGRMPAGHGVMRPCVRMCVCLRAHMSCMQHALQRMQFEP